MTTTNLGKVRITPQGEHDSTKAYSLLDWVTSGGSGYVALKDVPVGVAISNTEYWQLSAERGADGTDGAKGDKGDTGPKGDKGDPGEVTEAELEAALATKANTDGEYEEMTVGNAEQLVSTVGSTDTAPYVFRTTGGSADVGNRKSMSKIVGGSVVVNQLVDALTDSVTIPSGRKYVSVINGTWSIGASDGTAISVTGGQDMVIDLTQMLGVSIADYAYTLESATAGSGIAWLRSFGYLTEPYIPYNAGTLTHVSGLTSHDTVGFNQWDEEWVAGYLANDGSITPNTNGYLCAKNLIPILPNTQYYLKMQSDVWRRFAFYDANGDFLRYTSATVNAVFTTPADASYMRFDTNNRYGTTYKNDICLNLSWNGSRNGEYAPYVKHSYPLDSTLTLRGIPTLTSVHEIEYNGDEYLPDGTVTRRYGIIDMGTLPWSYQSESQTFMVYSSQITPSRAVGKNLICAKYVTMDTAANNAEQILAAPDKNIIWQSSNAHIRIKDSAYTDAASFKAAMSGVYLIYELATPTTEQAEPYQETQICDDWGTEDFAGASIPVGHSTWYMANLRDKLQHLPDLPSADGDYIIRVTGTQMYLVPKT